MAKILLVEDYDSLADVQTDLLEAEGHQVVLASSADGALDEMQISQFDLVIVEPLLNDGSGTRLLQNLISRDVRFGIHCKWLDWVDSVYVSAAAFAIEKPVAWDGEDGLSAMISTALVEQIATPARRAA